MPGQPSENEEEYFARLEIKRRLEAEAKRALAQAEEEKKRLKDLHFMHCPKCGNALSPESLEKVTVDVCPVCHGIWLDDGELTKVIESKRGVLGAIRGLFS
jgi:RNA polymerase-binding transcription factor DksA